MEEYRISTAGEGRPCSLPDSDNGSRVIFFLQVLGESI